jgi:Rrf2 family protein
MISDTGRHAIKALTILAQQEDGTPLGAKQIASQINAPRNYLGKLLQNLAAEGLLESTKGHGGGFSLSKPPHKISLFEVLDPIEKMSKQPDCFLGWKKCADSRPCAFHHQWKPLREARIKMLKTTTLADIVQGEFIE